MSALSRTPALALILAMTLPCGPAPALAAPGTPVAVPAVQGRSGSSPVAPPGSSALPAVQAPVTSITSLSADQLQALPDAQLVQVGTTRLTKGELMRRFSAVHARAMSPGAGGGGLVRRGAAELLASFHAEVEANNSKVMSAHQARAGPAPSPSAGSLTVPPKVTEVMGVAMDGSLLLVKGSFLGDQPGSVALEGSFTKPPVMKIEAWASDGFLVRCSLPDGGATDQVANLRITRKDGQSLKTVVMFKAEIVDVDVSAMDLVSSVSMAPGGWTAEHHFTMKSCGVLLFRKLLPNGKVVSGSDSITLCPLKNGYTYLASVGELSDVKHASLTKMSSPVTLSWWFLPPSCKGELTDDMLAQCDLGYVVWFQLFGPKGLPYK